MLDSSRFPRVDQWRIVHFNWPSTYYPYCPTIFVPFLKCALPSVQYFFLTLLS